ncbi:hypothetical protein [Loktanella atrilutea]|uniref:hypothetical protein n=1 Tax=Loktanella atrilutea TaxID=366533 RepID=UPI0011601E2B|nr:hypothetical protein [Loktanella atrilutea]
MSEKSKFSGLSLYWRTYGRWSSVLRSPYFWRSFVPFFLLFPLWVIPVDGEYRWTAFSLAVLPSFLSFSLAALAIILSMPTGQFFQIITEEDESENGNRDPSFYLQVASSFTHFIVVQILALFLILLTYAYPYIVTSALGFYTFCYAIACGIAAVSTLMSYANLRKEAASLEVNDAGE